MAFKAHSRGHDIRAVPGGGAWGVDALPVSRGVACPAGTGAIAGPGSRRPRYAGVGSREEVSHEAHLPALADQAEAFSRLPAAHEHPRRPQDPVEPPPQGPLATGPD